MLLSGAVEKQHHHEDAVAVTVRGEGLYVPCIIWGVSRGTKNDQETKYQSQ